MTFTVYEDDAGDLFRVSPGISDGKVWMSVRIKFQGRGAQHRVKSKNLPLRDTREEAQVDLDAYAERKGLRKVATI